MKFKNQFIGLIIDDKFKNNVSKIINCYSL